jgi:hypothetical protein
MNMGRLEGQALAHVSMDKVPVSHSIMLNVPPVQPVTTA